jgi:putative ABC transport system ATP-binding protein
MNLLGCLDTPSEGVYELNGVNVADMDDNQLAEIRNREIGFVFQSFNLLARTSALENVELPLLYSQKHRLTDAEQLQKARGCLGRVGLAERWDHTPAQLSGGQQQRVAVARALVNDPAILLADEPTGNLDSKTSDEIMGIFQSLNEEGKTVVLITHEHDIAEYARRVVAFRDGRIVADEVVTKRRSAKGAR